MASKTAPEAPVIQSRNSFFKLGLLLLLVLACAAPAGLEAREAEYGRYLGVRLRMYDEAYQVLDEAIKSASGTERSRLMRIKAEVMISQGDHEFQRTGDVAARNRLYQQALGIFGEATDTPSIATRGELMNRLARETRRTDPEGARAMARNAAEMLDKERKRLEELRMGLDDSPFRAFYNEYSRIFFQMCTSHYIAGLTYEPGSSGRLAAFRDALNWLGEFQFALDDPTEEQILSFELQGEIALASGNPEQAVGHFMGLTGFVSTFNINSYVGRLALQHGYLRAAEILTNELDFEPANLERTIALFAEANARYGQFSDLEFHFKRFQLFRISAQIKLGGDQIRTAIDQLFRLAADRDVGFRRQAMSVLAEVATRPELDDATRLRCAETVYSELATNSIPVVLRNIAAYQSILTSANTVERFETYAPLCFIRIAEMYSSMWRFLDAALVYREAAYRTGYFMNKFDGVEQVPAHMRDRCPMITDANELRAFPSEMATLFRRHAVFLTSAEYGEPNNREYQALLNEANELRAALGGLTAQRDLMYQLAQQQFANKNYAQAAVRYLSLPTSYRSYHIGLYVAARCYYLLMDDIAAPRISRRGADEERESDEFFAEQRDRHATDLAVLPRTMWEGIEAPHWEAIMDSSTPDNLANWHKAVYFYKKYFLIEAARIWPQLEENFKDEEGNLPDNLTMADAIRGVAQVYNQRYMRENPTGGDGDRDMKRMGYAAYDLAYLLRNPPRNVAPVERERLRELERGLALDILRPFWTLYGPHLLDSPNYQRGALRLAFGALIDAEDGDAAEEVYRAYAEAFPEDTEQHRSMVTRVYAVLSRTLSPRVNAMLRASSRMVSRANELKKHSYERLPTTHPQVEEELRNAKTREDRQRILGEFFWNYWIVETIFGEDERGQQVRENLPDLLPTVKRQWDEMAEAFPRRWHQAMRAEFDGLIAADRYASIREEATKLLGEATPGQLLDVLEKRRDELMPSDEQKGALYAQLAIAINLNTEALAWFTGTVWIYEFAEFLAEQAAEVDGRARPLTTRVLRYYEEYRMQVGQGGTQGLSETDMLNLGRQYFRIRDWRQTVRYLTSYAERVEASWGDVKQIPVDERQRLAGRTESNVELEVRYQLGKAHLEMYRTSRDRDHLIKAALHIRRCWSYNLVRDANVLGGDRYRLLFQDSIERFYLPVGEAMSEIYLFLHEAGDIKIEWPEYANQFTTNLQTDRERPVQQLPTDAAGYLWSAREIHLRVWASFRQLSVYQYRTEFRVHLQRWMEMNIRWVKAYGTETHGIHELTTRTPRTVMQEAYTVARNEAAMTAFYLNPATERYLERLKALAEELADVCQEAGITINRVQ